MIKGFNSFLVLISTNFNKSITILYLINLKKKNIQKKGKSFATIFKQLLTDNYIFKFRFAKINIKYLWVIEKDRIFVWNDKKKKIKRI